MSDSSTWQLRSFLMELISAHLSEDDGASLTSKTWDIYWKAVSSKHPSSLLLAEYISLDFIALLSNPTSTVELLCRYYTMLHDLYRDPAQRMSDIQRFDTNAVIPFAEWLKGRYPASNREKPRSAEAHLKIGYLCTWGLFTPDSPAPNILAALISEQARLANRQVYTYITVASDPAFVSAVSQSTVRDYACGYNFTNLDDLYQSIVSDGIDVLIADIPTATATYLFCRRAAPMQILLDIGAPFWSVPGLDWVLTHNRNPELNVSFSRSIQSSVLLAQAQGTQPSPQISSLRLPPPNSPLVLGNFGRVSKLSPEFIIAVKEILRRLPQALFLMLGKGSSPSFSRLLHDPEFSDRVKHFDQPASIDDVLYFGRALHIFIDSFPLTGSHSIYRALSLGLPVVSRFSPDVDRLALQERDEMLLTWNSAAYIDMVCRLANDHQFYSDSSKRSLSIAPIFNDTSRMIADVEGGISSAIAHYSTITMRSTNNLY